MTVIADNTHENPRRIPAREYPSLDEVPLGVGFNRVVNAETGECWIRASLPNQPARWFRSQVKR